MDMGTWSVWDYPITLLCEVWGWNLYTITILILCSAQADLSVSISESSPLDNNNIQDAYNVHCSSANAAPAFETYRLPTYPTPSLSYLPLSVTAPTRRK